MTALAANRGRSQKTMKMLEFTLASGNIAYAGARAALNTSTGKVQPASAAIGLLMIGYFVEKVDATSADKTCTVDFEKEIQADWMANATSTDAVASTDLGKLCYQVDDQTVGILSGVSGGAGRSVAGRVWAVDTTKGVLVEKLSAVDGLGGLGGALPSTGSYTSNDYAPTSISSGIYDVPTTGAASTITLPAAAPDGTVAFFAADGTKNAHTVQYRDATGPTNLTTALTASKRHLVVAAKRDGKWFANAYVSP